MLLYETLFSNEKADLIIMKQKLKKRFRYIIIFPTIAKETPITLLLLLLTRKSLIISNYPETRIMRN